MSDYPIIPILRLLRFPNLLVVALTQWLVYFRVIQPALNQEGIAGVLTLWKFFEIVIVTLMITASGYLVNDLQDEKIDEINRPGTNPVKIIGRDGVMWTYGVMLLCGFLVSQLLAYRLGERQLLWIFPTAIAMLSIYSTGLKKVPVLGNLVVAAFCAGVPGVLVLAERKAVLQLLDVNPELGMNALRVCLVFMVFAFIATMLRELVKDLEDIRGDKEAGRKTIPVMLGIPRSRMVALALGLVVILAVLSPIFMGWMAFQTVPMMTCIGLLILGLLFILFRLLRASGPTDYHGVSTLLKFFLLAGLGLLAVF